MVPFTLGLVVFFSLPWVLPWVFGKPGQRVAARVLERLRPHVQPEPVSRPVEEIAEDVRVRGVRFHRLPANAPAAKQAAVASAYDLVLTEMCAALGQAHLLQVLATGTELDAERRRVELVLMSYGLPPADAA